MSAAAPSPGQLAGKTAAGGAHPSAGAVQKTAALADVAHLSSQMAAVEMSMPFRVVGRVTGVNGLTIEADDLALPVGALCRIDSFGEKHAFAEVVGFVHDRTLLMPLAATSGIARGDRIENVAAAPTVGCSPLLLGRVLNGLAQPIDGKGPLSMTQMRRLDARAANCMDRVNIDQPIATSVRCIDAVHTCGLGQRMGIFSGPGVGKSTLLSQIAKHTSADVSVVCLVGERGREVQEFLTHSLGPDGLARCVVIVSTSDDAPLLRVRSAKLACTVAEYFRDEGKNVLLLIDSITRLCQAQRQIGLAAREPPATKGFPPSVFALLPEILERAGRTAKGSITGFYTVLVEGDDFNEPVPDAVKGITDGHIWLDRTLADRGHFPAIDVLRSLSRVRSSVVDAEHNKQARRVLEVYAKFQQIEDLVSIGAYVPGANLENDLAFQMQKRIVSFLQQDSKQPTTMATAVSQLKELNQWIEQADKTLKAQAAKPVAKK